MAERPDDPGSASAAAPDFAARNGWDRDYETFSDFDLPTYVGPTSFMKLPWITDPAELRARAVDVAVIGAPFDDAVSHRPGARFGPRAIREAQYTSGSINSLQLDVEPFEVLTVVDAGDAGALHQADALVGGVLAGDEAELAADALVLVDVGDDAVVQVELAPVAHAVGRQPDHVGHAREALRVHPARQPVDQVAHHAEAVLHGGGADLYAGGAHQDELGRVAPALDAADADLAACLYVELAGVVETYEELKKSSGKLDFLDLLLITRDLLVANDISASGSGFDADANAVVFVWPAGEVEELPRLPKAEVAAQLLDRIEKLRRAGA